VAGKALNLRFSAGIPSGVLIMGTFVGAPSMAEQLLSVFPNLARTVSCPLGAPTFTRRLAGGCLARPLINQIIHLNDSHGWSRERIADWLETLPLVLTTTATNKGD
jgi:hypothetical protein